MTAVLTFDIDWAPDWTIRLCHQLCRAAGVPATFYATHRCDALDELKAAPEVEVGIHPNFLGASSHGSDIRSVLAHCSELVPGARSMRTHGLYQSTSMYAAIMDHCPSIIADASLFLPDHPGLRPTLLHLGGRRPLVRLPYWWEDDIAASTPGFDWRNCPAESGGLQIYDFHPIHVALNTRTLDGYRRLKQDIAGPLWNVSERDMERFSNRDQLGTRSFLEALLRRGGPGRFTTIKAVADAFLAGRENAPCG